MAYTACAAETDHNAQGLDGRSRTVLDPHHEYFTWLVTSNKGALTVYIIIFSLGLKTCQTNTYFDRTCSDKINFHEKFNCMLLINTMANRQYFQNHCLSIHCFRFRWWSHQDYLMLNSNWFFHLVNVLPDLLDFFALVLIHVKSNVWIEASQQTLG